jgi:hypothetical protein
MALSRPFAYNDTGSPISGTTQYGDLVIGNIEAPYGTNYGGVRWWGGPDQDLRYVIGNARPDGQPVPSGVTETAYVGFWGTELGDKTNESFLNLANYIGDLNNQPPFASAPEASAWLTNNGFWNSYPQWSAGGALITGRRDLAGAGTQNAGLAFGGVKDPPVMLGCTEEYNGTSWTTGGPLISRRYGLAGAGTQNAGLAFGGVGAPLITVSCTEEYNGSSWTAGGALITGRDFLAGAGTQDAGLAFGGTRPSITNCTEEYNGSSWSVGNALINGTFILAGTGIQNAGLAFGGVGNSSPALCCTEEYNGISWTAGGSLITGRAFLAGSGTQNASLAFGGSVPTSPFISTCTEEYNGSSWSSASALSTARYRLGGTGTQKAGLAFGGDPGYLSCTEEYS